MGPQDEAQFWREQANYHDLAKAIDRHTEITHPNIVSGQRGCNVCHNCSWCATSVCYLEYRGPDITPA